MRTSIARFVEDESGATAIEYGLIAAGSLPGQTPIWPRPDIDLPLQFLVGVFLLLALVLLK